MSVKVTNNARSSLASGITSVATSLTVPTGQGARFPTLGVGDQCYITISNTMGEYEIVRATARTDDTFTVVRNIGGTNQAWDASDFVELRIVS